MSSSRLAVFAAGALLAAAPASLAQLPFASAERDSIDWIETSDDALRSAAATGRPILAFVTSENCVFCRKMQRESWSDAGVAGRVRAGFTPLRLQAETNAEAVRSLQVRAFPTTIVLSPEGRGLGVLEGFVGPERLTQVLDSIGQPATDSVAVAN